MSYSLETPCNGCVNENKCNDRHFLEGAINGIHSVWPSSKGHFGAGTVTIDCQNFEPINPAAPGEAKQL